MALLEPLASEAEPEGPEHWPSLVGKEEEEEEEVKEEEEEEEGGGIDMKPTGSVYLLVLHKVLW